MQTPVYIFAAYLQDADDDLNELITREYHFGGDEDLFTKKSTPATIDGDDTPDSPAHKSKKEARDTNFRCRS